MVVIRNLGACILIGEPGKKDNKIVTIPHKKVIELLCDVGNKVVLPYAPKDHPQISSHATCRAIQNKTIYPGQSINIELPTSFKSDEQVAISCRKNMAQSWIGGRIIPVNGDGTVTITNKSNDVVRFSRLEHFADVRSCSKVFIQDLKNGNYVKKIYDINPMDVSHLVPSEPIND